MMTKEEHINYWVVTAHNDWITVEAMFSTERFMHGLSWAHLVLEKLAKANWVRTHQENIPPKVHNIIWLLDESNVDLGEEMTSFIYEFNRFQLSSRYPDYANDIYNMCTKEFSEAQLEKVKEVRTCLLKML